MQRDSITILIANRVATTRATLRKTLFIRGYTSVLTADNGKQALELLQIHDVRLAVVDTDLADIPGLDILKIIRSTDRLKDLPFALTASKADVKSISAALELGISSLILKPFTSDLFLEIVLPLLEQLASGPPFELLRNDLATALAAQQGSALPDAQPITAAPAKGYQDLSVLAVDDSSSMRHLLNTHLKAIGFTDITFAVNGAQAWEILSSDKRIDLVLSDWKMPKMTGLELLDHIRSHDKTATIPFVFITSEAKMDHILLAGKHSASSYLIKPFTLLELHEVINSIYLK